MIISFDKKLYKLKAIKEAIKDYKGINLSLKKDSSYFKVELILENKKNLDKIKDEFCNYVLYKMFVD